jgi:peptidoglycan/xylan/chitin deacetylase (PgdA/CDA1 family)
MVVRKGLLRRIGEQVFLKIAALTFFYTKPTSDRPIIVAFRYDDYSTTSATALEKKIMGLFREARAAITFGVIPFVAERDGRDPSLQNLLALSPEKLSLLKTAADDGVVEVALHGYSHQSHLLNEPSEFRGLPYNDQLEKITQGRRFLEENLGTPIATFIPPWNRYDENTLAAIAAQKILILSAGKRGPVASNHGVNVLHATCNLKHLRRALVQARRSNEPQPIVVVLFHSYDFKEINPRGYTSDRELAELLGALASRRDIQLMSISQASQRARNFG